MFQTPIACGRCATPKWEQGEARQAERAWAAFAALIRRSQTERQAALPAVAEGRNGLPVAVRMKPPQGA